MANPTGFMDYEREEGIYLPPKERVKNYKEFHKLLDPKRQEIQASRCMQCGVPFCQAGIQFKNEVMGCSNLNLIPEWNDLLSRGLWELAYRRLSLTMPFPEITGRICPAPCELSCVCTANGAPVTIKDNELAIAEYAFENDLVKPRKIDRNGLKVAIVGSGPAGLACADFLNLLGYEVHVYERDKRAGGLLMYGIPDMKLEKSVVQRRLGLLEKEGVVFHVSSGIESKSDFEKLKSGVAAVVLAIGARRARDLELEGGRLDGVHDALDFLVANTKEILDSEENSLKATNKDVVVIGSGDTSTDCVAVALRQGAKSITRLERSPKKPLSRPANNPWPQAPLVLQNDYGITEYLDVKGVDPRRFSTSPKAFLGSKHVEGVRTIGLQWNQSGTEGRRKSQEVLDSQAEIKASLVLKALGFSGCEIGVEEIFGVKTKGGLISEKDFKTSMDGVYACGDCRIGASLVVSAIKEGRECARRLHEDLLRAPSKVRFDLA